MKKKIIFLILILITVLSCVLLFRPTSIPQDAVFAGGMTFHIVQSNKKGLSNDITLSDENVEKVEEMKNILLDIKMQRTLEEKTTIHHTENPIVVYTNINHKTWTFIFGEEDCVYGPGILSRYKILNANEIMERIEKVMEE